MNGLSAPMDDLLEIADRHRHPKFGPLKVIGDAARACGGSHASGVASGDLDNDGDIDFVITHWTKRDVTSVFLNRGGGEFFPRKEYQTALGNYGVALADVDDDGNLDVVTANYQARSYSLLKGVGDGTFEIAVTTPAGLRLHEGKWVPETLIRP